MTSPLSKHTDPMMNITVTPPSEDRSTPSAERSDSPSRVSDVVHRSLSGVAAKSFSDTQMFRAACGTTVSGSRAPFSLEETARNLEVLDPPSAAGVAASGDYAKNVVEGKK